MSSRQVNKTISKESWVAVAAREALGLRPSRKRAAELHDRCSMLIDLLRSGSRRRNYGALRAELRDHRKACAKYL